jgi:prepilin-type N-terminal cleavage/methylation domain-containing protein
MRSARAAGFTLLETIVTLVIVSLMVALLMQALSQVLNLRQRVLRLQGEARIAALQERWFRESLQAPSPTCPTHSGSSGGSRSISNLRAWHCWTPKASGACAGKSSGTTAAPP